MPVLAIGNDIYCDSSLIIHTLERRFSSSSGYGTIYPRGKHGCSADTGLLKAFAMHYGALLIYNVMVPLLPWEETYSKETLDDRSKFLGRRLDSQKLAADRSKYLSDACAHLQLVEEQLSDDREWLFDTESPSVADLSIHFAYNWAKSDAFGDITKPLFDNKRFPKAMKWLDRLNTYLDSLKSEVEYTDVNSADGNKQVAEGTHEEYLSSDEFDETSANWLGVKRGQTVLIRPEDAGKEWPHEGKLIWIDNNEFCVESQGKLGTFRVHFPRIGFTIEPGASIANSER